MYSDAAFADKNGKVVLVEEARGHKGRDLRWVRARVPCFFYENKIVQLSIEFRGHKGRDLRGLGARVLVFLL